LLSDFSNTNAKFKYRGYTTLNDVTVIG